jgi:hypothetical protein
VRRPLADKKRFVAQFKQQYPELYIRHAHKWNY